jgi:hypothetical protein
MSDADAPTPSALAAPARPGRRAQPIVTKVTLYERVSSALMAAMLGVGAILFAAVTYWLSHRPPPELKVVPLEIVQLEPEVDFGGSLDGVVGGTAEVDTGMEGGGGGGESIGSDVPTLETTLATVTSVAGTAAQQTTSAYLDAATPSSNTTGSGTGGSGTGTGGGRPPLGFGPGKGGGVPRELRWFVSFADDNSLDEYAKQLDAFGIELGVLMPDGRLIYVSQLSKPAPMQRVSTSGKDEKRLYFTWQGGERQQADLKLFQKAGINVGKGTIYHFYPPRLEEVLATLEFNYAKRKAKEIRRTYFVVEKQGGAYGFKVTRQTTLL